MHHPTDKIAYTMAFVTPVMEHWLEQEIDMREMPRGSLLGIDPKRLAQQLCSLYLCALLYPEKYIIYSGIYYPCYMLIYGVSMWLLPIYVRTQFLKM